MLDDSDDPDVTDMDEELDDGDEAADTDPCPSCGTPVYEDAEVCPHCGQYISDEESSNKKPMWLIVSVGVCIALILIVWVLESR